MSLFKQISILLFFLFISFLTHAQSNSSSLQINEVKKRNVQDIHSDFFPKLLHLEAIQPGGSSYASFLQQQKQIFQENTSSFNPNQKNFKTHAATTPVLGTNFQGNPYDYGVPNDNTMAISNGGIIVSCINSTIYAFYDTGGSAIMSVSLNAFTDSSFSVSSHQFDPKVVYDPKQDRFILVYLAGSESALTHIMVCFSETNNPTGNWYQYSLPGNPYSTTSWSDYPIIAMTDDEFFVTVNLIKDDSSWQAGFDESLLWQIDKSNGYSGASLNTLLHHNVQFAGKPIRNLFPVQGGATTYGPDLYLLSNRNFAYENDTFFVMHLSGNIASSPSISVQVALSNQNYGLPPDGRQASNLKLATNDARVLGAYYENNQIQFAGNTYAPATNSAGIFHGILNPMGADNNLTLNILSDSVIDYGYPNLSYTGRYLGDDQCIVSFNHTSVDSSAGMSAVFYERYAQYSEPIITKRGTEWVNIIPGAIERWGDYSGSQRKYNEAGVVWTSGFYSKRIPGSPIQVYANNTWIVKLESPYSIPQSVGKVVNETSSLLYPNPANSAVFFNFMLEKSESIRISLFDENGKLIRLLYNDRAKAGENRFNFSAQSLAVGNYYVLVENKNGILFRHSFIKN